MRHSVWGSWLVATAWLMSACAPKSVPQGSAAFDAAARLASADSLVTQGCLDCLEEAFAEYVRLADAEPGTVAAADGAIHAGLLIALRESELGLPPRAKIDDARRLAPLASRAATELLAVADALIGPQVDARVIRRSANDWAARLRAAMPNDVASAYVWLSLACGSYGDTIDDRDDRSAIIDHAARVPLLAYKLAVTCNFRDRGSIAAIYAREPRFRELEYWLGLIAIAGQPQINGPAGLPDLDEADTRLTAAYAWRRNWPALTLALANVALTAEDFPRAFDLFDQTLTLRSDDADAFLGKIRTLTYLDRSAEAIATADRLLALNRNPGEARYWRAYNELRTSEVDTAWADVELAGVTLINADVPKLAGLIAIRRRQLDVARERLELSLVRRATDCETRFYLQAVWAEQRQWAEAARAAADAGACLDDERAQLTSEIARRRTEPATPRRDRQIARREGELASALRMRATSTFNGAAANFNLGRRVEARRLAELLLDDSQFGERARALIEQLGPEAR